MTKESTAVINRGSEWHRWEPHIHAPGTILNDGYVEADAWERYLDALESVTPALRAIGITDYCSIETYKRVKAAKDEGRLKDCDVLFPNVELRLDIGTKKGNQVNIHLLVSPDASNHIAELERFLGRLKFRAHDDEFACTPGDLMRLGRKHDPKAKEDRAALAAGINQFKVSRKDLLEQYELIRWAKDNILIAVAGGADGTSGVQDAADATLREEIEKGAHAIFASSLKQREFWLGRSSVQTAEAIRERYGSLKPCLWGCDAHSLSKVAKPDENRFCWVKGIPTFDTLRQACIDPTRAYVGENTPTSGAPSQVIAEVEIGSASWARTPHIYLNPGFVAIIGARGSGKTALADMIAAGCDAYEGFDERPSFLARAREKLTDETVELKWLDGRTSGSRYLAAPSNTSSDAFSRARYLSQQFVEKICSIEGMPRLVREIERVIFEAHSEAERDGTFDFQELLNLKAGAFRETRTQEEAALAEVSDQIGIELEKDKLLAGLKTQVEEKTKQLARYVADKAALMPKTPSKHTIRLQEIEAAAAKAQQNLRYFINRQQALRSVSNEVANFRSNEAPHSLRTMKTRNTGSGLNDDSWQLFLLKYSGDVDGVLSGQMSEAERNANGWRGLKPSAAVTSDGAFIAADADLTRQPLAVLEVERERLQRLVASDTETQNRLIAISRRISEETIALETLQQNLKDAEGARGRAKALVDEREAGYGRIFDAILSEEQVLNELYAPLMTQLTTAGGSLAKLSFSVARVADHQAWAKRGEDLFDLRGGPFKGIGSLAKIAETTLSAVWQSGTSDDAAKAMKAFRGQYEAALLSNAPVPKSDQVNYRTWTRRFAQWLYSTDHIKILYGVRYDGTDIHKLSPGTRGIVVLLLYLALDRNEVSPLIIDQPEENLDPKSIFDELVPLFDKAKQRRQVIMVTHNANLVVNANADQIIIADVGRHTTEGLPPISYRSGGLEEADIRKQVCDILEGGQEAFKERGRRLRIGFTR